MQDPQCGQSVLGQSLVLDPCPPVLVPSGLTYYLLLERNQCICSDGSPMQASSGQEGRWPLGPLQGQSSAIKPLAPRDLGNGRSKERVFLMWRSQGTSKRAWIWTSFFSRDKIHIHYKTKGK